MTNKNRSFPVIYASRMVYAINWFTIAPALIYIQTQLSVSPFDLGLIASAFFIGLMPFQLIGGLIALKVSPRMLAIIGMAMIGVFSIVSGISDTFIQLFFARIFLGVGSALFSSPALSLLSMGSKDQMSRRVGYYNALFSVGSGISIVLWTMLDPVYGWRASMFSTGILSMICFILLVAYAEKSQSDIPSNIGNKSVLDIIRDRKRWMLGFSAAIAPLSETVIGQFFIYYSEKTHILTQFNSGIALSIYFIIGLAGGVIYGRFYGKMEHKSMVYLLTVIFCSLLFMSLSFITSTYLVLAALWAIGFLTAAILSMLYYNIMEMERGSDYLTFSLGLNNFMQKIISIISPIIFIFIAIRVNYSESLLLLGITGLGLAFLYPGVYFSFHTN